jgi:hypothetical protein
LQLSDTEEISRLSIGDRVKTKFVLEFDDIRTEFDYIGYIVDINERYVIPSIKSSYRIEYKLEYRVKTDSRSNIVSWVDGKDVVLYTLQDEREEKLNKILNEKL